METVKKIKRSGGFRRKIGKYLKRKKKKKRFKIIQIPNRNFLVTSSKTQEIVLRQKIQLNLKCLLEHHKITLVSSPTRMKTIQMTTTKFDPLASKVICAPVVSNSCYNSHSLEVLISNNK